MVEWMLVCSGDGCCDGGIDDGVCDAGGNARVVVVIF